jgi:hypothetical protein
MPAAARQSRKFVALGRRHRVDAPFACDLEADVAVQPDGVLVLGLHPEGERGRTSSAKLGQRVHELVSPAPGRSGLSDPDRSRRARSGSPSGLASAALSGSPPPRLRFVRRLGGPVFNRRTGPAPGGCVFNRRNWVRFRPALTATTTCARCGRCSRPGAPISARSIAPPSCCTSISRSRVLSSTGLPALSGARVFRRRVRRPGRGGASASSHESPWSPLDAQA